MNRRIICVLALQLLLALPLSFAANASSVSLPPGEYTIGIDIPEGEYRIILSSGTVIRVDNDRVKVVAFQPAEEKSEFDKLDEEFDQITDEIARHNEVIALCDEYDELLALLTSTNHGLSSSDELDKKLRYYEIKKILRGLPGNIIRAEDGDLEGFQSQVADLRKAYSVLLTEARDRMMDNLKLQAVHYMDAVEAEKQAKAKLQEALDYQSSLVQKILLLVPDN